MLGERRQRALDQQGLAGAEHHGGVPLTVPSSGDPARRHGPWPVHTHSTRLRVLALSLLLPAALHYVCTAAERHRPRRIAFLFVFHLMIIFAVLQTLPPLLIPIGLLQLGWLWHKGIRA